MRKCICFLTLATVAFAKPLNFTDMKTINEKIFAYHILFESYDETVAKRSVSKIFSSFDPLYFYFLKSERDKYSKVSEKMVVEYKNGSFTTYLSIKETFETAVKRCRNNRAQIRQEILTGKIDVNSEYIKRPQMAPSSKKELKKHMTAFMVSHLRAYSASKGVYRLDKNDTTRVLDYYERKMQAHEDRLLQKDGYPLVVSKMIASSLDAHSMIYDQNEISNINSHLKSRFEGIGIYLADGIDGPEITGCVKGGPAARSGQIEKGDVIEYINGVKVSDMSFGQVMELLSAKEGNKITLQVNSKAGEKKVVKMTAERIAMQKDKIAIETESFMDGQIATLRIDTFYNDFEGSAMGSDLKKTILELRREKPLYGIVIDMRKNLGGFFKEAVKATSLFCKKQTVVVAKFRDDQVRYSKEYDPHITYVGPIVILTSKYSASAAEILAQSLQDVGVAVIAGDHRTYGKGSIQFQTLTDPQSYYKYKVTVGKYYTISGTSTQLKGVKADVIVPSQYAHQKIGEKHLTFALPSGDLNRVHSMHPEVREVFEFHSKRQKTVYEVMKPQLKKNSEARISNNKNYQAFLKALSNPNALRGKSLEDRKKSQFGKNDLQMAEAVNIIKDMHYMMKSY
ncbi:MAG: Tail-specific protease [Chlamydiia bacterium]|nr:Tail-specific protease [Chlamydiia bacterium]